MEDLPILSPAQVQETVRQLHDGMTILFPGEVMDVILYGSYARGEAQPGSDLDVMVLLDTSREDIAKRKWDISGVGFELSLDCGVMVSLFVENRTFFQTFLPALPFFQNVSKEGIRFYG
ncbi:MAG: nucleotidyltransferase domain-containing protein [Oscillospiraceae bacterium]|nr:nucleotidyltransferase domain-containing protein [Oscillospiraceae bacterium]